MSGENNVDGTDVQETLDARSEDCRRSSLLLGDHYDFIVERLLPDFGLIDKLYSASVLTNEEKNNIKSRSTPQEKNRIILECINKKDAYEKFTEILQLSNQTHLVKYLKYNGNYKTEFGGDWPLTDKEISTLDSNFEVLVDLLEPTELLGRLLASKVISARQLEFISAKPTTSDRNEALLEILRRGSIASYWATVRCLHLTNQSHIAEILEDGGVVVSFHLEIEDGQTEDEVIASFARQLGNRPLEESRRILEGTLNVIAMKKGQSIIIYVYCRTLEELLRLEEMQLNGSLLSTVKELFARFVHRTQEIQVTADNLKTILESIFSQILNLSELKKTSITSSEKEFAKYIPYFMKKENCGSISDTKISVIIAQCLLVIQLSELPWELLDIILTKVYLRSIRRPENESQELRDEDVIRRLSSLDGCWFNRITKRRFKHKVWRHLRRIYWTKRNSCLLYKDNKQFVLENSHFTKDFKTLKSSDYLSDVEAAVVSRKQFSAVKKQTQFRYQMSRDAPSSSVKYSDDIKVNDFVRCLCQKGERLTARIISNREVVLRVEFRNSKSLDKTPPAKQYVRKCREIKGNSSPALPPDARKIFHQLEEDGLEIMNAIEDREIAVWIWCRTSSALDKLKSVVESRGFDRKSHQMTGETLESQRPRNINMDCDQLEKEFELFSPMKVNFKVERDFSEAIARKGSLVGLTKLRSRIHALFFGVIYPVMQTFHDRHPFCLQDDCELKSIKVPSDIGSSEKDNCLYVIDCGHNNDSCVWRIKATAETVDRLYEVSKWLILDKEFKPQTLSVSSDGHVLMAGRYEHPVSVRIYGAEADLLLSVRLNQCIESVRYAVEASSGELIVFHWTKKYYETRQKRKNTGERGRKDTSGKNTSEEEGEREEEEEEEEGVALTKLSRDGQRIISCFYFRRAIPLLAHSHTEYFDAINAYICIDSGDRLFVADTGSDRVVTFNSDLRLNQILVPENKAKVANPHRLYYDEQLKQLIVGGFGEINVYTLIMR